MNEASENKKILYIFSGGRKERLTSDENFAKDFFYGFYNVKEKYPNTFIHEISHKHILIFKQIDSFIESNKETFEFLALEHFKKINEYNQLDSK